MNKLILILILTTFNLYAAENFTFDGISLRGSGCKRGSAQVITSPDDQAVSILFDDFSVEVPNYKGDNDNDEGDLDNRAPTSKRNKKKDHKKCNIILNTNLTSEEKVTHIEITIDLRGYTQVEKGAMAAFKARLINWNGPKRKKQNMQKLFVNKTWKGGKDEDWSLTKRVKIPVNSPCSKSGDRKFRAVINTSLEAKLLGRKPKEEAFAMAFLDSGDLTGKIKMKIKTQKCKKSPSRRNHNSRRYRR